MTTHTREHMTLGGHRFPYSQKGETVACDRECGARFDWDNDWLHGPEVCPKMAVEERADALREATEEVQRLLGNMPDLLRAIERRLGVPLRGLPAGHDAEAQVRADRTTHEQVVEKLRDLALALTRNAAAYEEALDLLVPTEGERERAPPNSEES